MATSCKSRDHPYSVTNALEGLQVEDMLTDVTISANGQLFNAHKAVLAVSSGYFKSLFNPEFQEKNQNEVKINTFSKDVVLQLMKFCYSGKIAFSDENVLDILNAALYLQIDGAVDLCYSFVNSCNSDCDVPKHFRVLCQAACVADTNGMVKEFERCCQRVAFWLIAIYKTETFVKWTTYDIFDKMLDRTDLTKKRDFKKAINKEESMVSDTSGYLEGQPKEDHVLKAVVDWLKYDWDTRKVHTTSLLKKVRLGTIETEVLEKLIDKDMQEMEGCQELLDMVQKRRTDDESQPIPGDMFCPRGMINVLLALKTQRPRNGDERTTKAQYFYHNDPDNNPDHIVCWTELNRFQQTPPFTHPIPELDEMIIVNDALYISHQNYHRGLKFSALNLRTCELTPVNFCHPSNQAALVYLDGWLYALDGYDGKSDYTNWARRYNLLNQTSEDIIDNLPDDELHDFKTISTVTHNGHIIMYGYDTSNVQGADKTEKTYKLVVYNPSNNEWDVVYQERHTTYTKSTSVKLSAVLVKEHHKFYRVIYHSEEVTPDTFKDTPQVNELVLDLESKPPTCQIGPPQDQSSLCDDNNDIQYQGEFCINNELFFNIKGTIMRTGHKMTGNERDDITRKKWKHVFNYKLYFACFTFGLIDVNILE